MTPANLALVENFHNERLAATERRPRRGEAERKLTSQVVHTINDINDVLQSLGVVVEAAHHWMTTHGENKPGVTMVSNTLLGCFRNDSTTRQEFLSLVRQG